MKSKFLKVAQIFFAGTFVLGAVLLSPIYANAQEVVDKVSKYEFSATVRKLEEALKGSRLLILGEFDYQKMQKMVGRNIPPAMGFNFFRPDMGNPIFEHDANAALEIPLKIVVVQRRDGKVVVRYRKPSISFKEYRGLSELAERLDKLVDEISDRATK